MTTRTSLPAAELFANDRRRVDSAIARSANRLLGGAPASVAAPIRYALEGGGKRLRPLLCVAAYRAVAHSEPNEAVFDVAVALELVHTYSLVHDDLPCMDDDEVRRGRPTVHRAFGDPAATVAALALVPLAWRQLVAGCSALRLDGDRTRAVALELARAGGGGGMVGGQWLDLESEGSTTDAAMLEAIHSRKTGALFTAAVRIGGLLAGGEARTVDALGRYGAALGHAFQITDDVLDETGDPRVLGKSAGKDRAQAKATYVALLGVAGAERKAESAVAEGVAALADAGIDDPTLRALLRHAVDRER